MNIDEECSKWNDKPTFDEAFEIGLAYKELMKTKEILQSGYGGILPNGNIVDRRKFPKAIPCQENELFNTPKPKKI